MAKQNLVETAGGFFEDITPRQNVQPVQAVQSVQDKRKEKSIESQTGRQTVHVHTLLFKDDLDELKEIAWKKHTTTNALLREIVTVYIEKQKKGQP